MRVLISRLSALGDTVCSLPVAAALKDSFPGCHITWVISPRFAPIVECCENVDQVMTYKFSLLRPPRFENQFDLALDIQGLLKSAWPVLWAKSVRKLGYHWQREGARFISQPVLPDPSSLHVVDQYVDVARAAGAHAERAKFGLRPATEAVDSVKAKLGEVDSPLVVINPSAGWKTKRWPPEQFGALIGLVAHAGLTPVLIGGGSEADVSLGKQVAALSPTGLVNLTGKTGLHELIALISLAAAHVGGDTGSSHLAAAMGIPAIGLYSITRPERSCPYGNMEFCHYDPDRLANISADTVGRTVLEVVNRLR